MDRYSLSSRTQCWTIFVCLGLTLGCASWNISRNNQIDLTASGEHLVIHTDIEIPNDSLVLANLNALPKDISKSLALTLSPAPVHVHLFATQEEYKSFVASKYPQLANRRAVFVNSPTGFSVYSYWTDNIAIDLRHEATHAYLNSTVTDLPLWLDEGLAEYFEVAPVDSLRPNHEHIKLLITAKANSQWQPSLERIAAVRLSEEMQAVHYAEAWLWAHFLLHGEEKNLLKQYLQEKAAGELVDPLGLQIRSNYSKAEELLLSHLENIATH